MEKGRKEEKEEGEEEKREGGGRRGGEEKREEGRRGGGGKREEGRREEGGGGGGGGGEEGGGEEGKPDTDSLSGSCPVRAQLDPVAAARGDEQCQRGKRRSRAAELRRRPRSSGTHFGAFRGGITEFVRKYRHLLFATMMKKNQSGKRVSVSGSTPATVTARRSRSKRIRLDVYSEQIRETGWIKSPLPVFKTRAPFFYARETGS